MRAVHVFHLCLCVLLASIPSAQACTEAQNAADITNALDTAVSRGNFDFCLPANGCAPYSRLPLSHADMEILGVKNCVAAPSVMTLRMLCNSVVVVSAHNLVVGSCPYVRAVASHRAARSHPLQATADTGNRPEYDCQKVRVLHTVVHELQCRMAPTFVSL